jgi:hypothetical protein
LAGIFGVPAFPNEDEKRKRSSPQRDNPALWQTVTIGSKVYTFQTVLTSVDGNVFIGASLTATLANLLNAINLGAGSGTAYAAATTKAPLALGLASDATHLIAKARKRGSQGSRCKAQ